MSIHPSVQSFVDEIDAFLAKTGMSKTAFGVRAINDPKLVPDLHKGRAPSLSTVSRVRDFMQREHA